MIWLLTRPVVWPAKVGFFTGRVVGFRRITVFSLGFVTGLLVAPMAGRELRALIQARVAAEPPIDLTAPPSPS